MRLPIFLLGFLVAVLASTALGVAVGFRTGTLVLFVIAVATVAQLAYVGLVAVLAAEQKQKTQRPGGVPRKTRSRPASPENDA